MEPIAHIDPKDLHFLDGIPVVRPHGSAAEATRELDEVWWPLLATGHRNVILNVDGLDEITPEILVALERMLRHIRGNNGEMALVSSRSDLVRALLDWDVHPPVPLLTDEDGATLAFHQREVA